MCQEIRKSAVLGNGSNFIRTSKLNNSVFGRFCENLSIKNYFGRKAALHLRIFTKLPKNLSNCQRYRLNYH